MAWLALGIALAVLAFAGGVGSIARSVGLIGAGAWLLASLMFLRHRQRGGMPPPNEYTGGLPPPDEHTRLPPEALPVPRRSQDKA